LFVIVCKLVLTGCLGISVRAQVAGQDWEKAAGGKQQFEVASVRENKTGGNSYSNFTLDGSGNMYFIMAQDDKTAPEGALFRATSQPLMRYIIFAYKLNGTEELALRVRQCPECVPWAGLGLNLPSWVADTHYNIEARAPGGGDQGPDAVDDAKSVGGAVQAGRAQGDAAGAGVCHDAGEAGDAGGKVAHASGERHMRDNDVSECGGRGRGQGWRDDDCHSRGC
jgi:hypothetical protein